MTYVLSHSQFRLILHLANAKGIELFHTIEFYIFTPLQWLLYSGKAVWKTWWYKIYHDFNGAVFLPA